MSEISFADALWLISKSRSKKAEQEFRELVLAHDCEVIKNTVTVTVATLREGEGK
jgi:hypothetical protein